MRRRLRRLGCGFLLFLWLLLLPLPCIVITLIAQGEIVVTWSDVPDDVLRVWLLQSSRVSGLGISTSSRVPTGENAVCTIVDVRFWVWQGSASRAGALPSHQCACYQRAGQAWLPTSTGAEACIQAGEPPEQK